MPGEVLSANDMTMLQMYASQNTHEARINYYTLLENRGYAYGELALGVVRDDTLSGIAARDYAAAVGSQHGVTLAESDWNGISQQLLQADFAARSAAYALNPSQPVEIPWQTIRDYHATVFDNFDLPPEAWTPFTILDQSANPDAAWANLVDNGGVSPFDNYHAFLSELQIIAAQERIDHSAELYLPDGRINPATANNPSWMRENMPASYQNQLFWQAGFMSGVMDTWILPDPIDRGREALDMIAQFLSDSRTYASDWVGDMMAVADANVIQVGRDIAAEWFGTVTNGMTEDHAEGYIPISELSQGLGDLYFISSRCEPTYYRIEESAFGFSEWYYEGKKYYSYSYYDENTQYDEQGKILGTIAVVRADEVVEIGESAFFVVYDPLILDLDGDGIETLSHLAHAGDEFDLLQDSGMYGHHGWVAPDDGLLALDENGNGAVDGISELFGDATTSGFAELATHDENHDGVINASDSVFNQLRVWVDSNSDGISTGELRSLQQLGITSISLNSVSSTAIDKGNAISSTAAFQMADGTEHTIADVQFAVDVMSVRPYEEFIV